MISGKTIQSHCIEEKRISYERELWQREPELAEILRKLSASIFIEIFLVSSPRISNPIYSRTNSPVSKSFRRAEITPAMACSNLSLHEAEIQHPHLFAYV